MKWNYILDPYEKFIATIKDHSGGFTYFKACRGAEILVHTKVHQKYLFNKVYVFSSEAKRKVLKTIDPFKTKIKIKVDFRREYFPLSPYSKEYWRRINYYNQPFNY